MENKVSVYLPEFASVVGLIRGFLEDMCKLDMPEDEAAGTYIYTKVSTVKALIDLAKTFEATNTGATNELAYIIDTLESYLPSKES